MLWVVITPKLRSKRCSLIVGELRYSFFVLPFFTLYNPSSDNPEKAISYDLLFMEEFLLYMFISSVYASFFCNIFCLYFKY